MGTTRREWLAAGSAAALGAGARPNILWITCEDITSLLGCYGDRYAATPNLDGLAREGVRYTNAFAGASVCSPSRSCLITGVWANSLGSMHLRGMVTKPERIRCFPEFLREAGYYSSNNSKEDYNFATPRAVWDESSGKAHWRKRAKGQPFFSVFNLMATHQGQIRYSRAEFEKFNAALAPELRHDPARAPLPPYYPDTPDVRLNLAILYTQVTRMDQQAGQILSQLEEDGLAEDTIVFFFGDNGTGLPRGKRFLHDNGLRVPFIARFPAKYRHLAPGPPGSTQDRLVNFADFGPTVLSLAGIPAPSHMWGSAFMGPHAGKPHRYLFAARDRVDEEIEVSRTVFDGRWQYIRNYHPHRPVLQHGTYSEVGYLWKELRRLDAEKKLSGDTAWLLRREKPPEELYDRESDPHQMNNLAGAPGERERLASMRRLLQDWMVDIRDTGLLPEADMLRRAAGRPPYEMRDSVFPVRRILDAAETVGRGKGELPRIRKFLADSDPAVRYWAATALRVLGAEARSAAGELKRALEDPSHCVRVAAAEALCETGAQTEAVAALARALEVPDACVQLQAVSALWHLGEKARPAIPALKKALSTKTEPEYQRTYFEWAAKKTMERLAT